jgi:acyl carrier protein
MDNRDKLKKLLTDVFLLMPEEFSFDLRREDVLAWDSLGLIAMAVGIKDTFGYHLEPEEALAIKGVQDIIGILEKKGIRFNGKT